MPRVASLKLARLVEPYARAERLPREARLLLRGVLASTLLAGMDKDSVGERALAVVLEPTKAVVDTVWETLRDLSARVHQAAGTNGRNLTGSG